ncbi:MAG TPA: hypothetical protein VLC48_09495, partial [Gemmatimonadota bacterium]|nr:hypothetical protein [Gemmatimonadota bacterium]
PYLPLQTRPSVAAGDYWLYIGNGQAPMIERRRLDGSANSIYRWVEAARRPAAAHYERYREEDIASASEGRRPLIAHYYREDLPLPEHLPVYQGLFVDDLGYLWVEQYRLPWEDPPQWEIFDPEGRWLGRVTTPRRFRLFQIGRDFILGRHRDEIGVERVRLYSLLKPEGGD